MDQKIHYWLHHILGHMNPIYALTGFREYCTLKMTALQTVETSRTIFPTTPRNIPDVWVFTVDFLKIHLNISQLRQGLQTDLFFFPFSQHVTGSLPCMSADTGWSKSLCAPDSMYSNIPHTIDDLKMAITEYIRNVDRVILNTVLLSHRAYFILI